MHGSLYISQQIKKIHHPFWKDVLKAWENILKHTHIKSNINLLTAPIWFNPLISQSGIFFPKWSKNNINFVFDLIDHQGTFHSQRHLKDTYPNLNFHFLEYHRIKTLVSRYINNHKQTDNFHLSFPVKPNNICILLRHKKGSKDFYKIQQTKVQHDNKFNLKWNADLGITLNNDNWKDIFKVCFKTIPHQNLIWLQYRILHRILGTTYLRHKMGKIESATCNKCLSNHQTILHLFTQCPIYTPLWQSLQTWINTNTTLNITLDPTTIIVGYLLKTT